jgi:amidohydrolase
VLFVFQPAEEGAPPGEEGGAELMLEEGVFEEPRPGAVFGLHVVPQHEVGEIGWRARGAMASSDGLAILVRGRQTHAAYPWLGVDPVTAASEIVLALQALPARRVDARTPSVVSFGMIHGGVRGNIIPDTVELEGTIRALSPDLRDELHRKVRDTADAVARSVGARAEVTIRPGYPVTWNDPELVRRMLPTLETVAGPGRLVEAPPRTGAEDFSYFAREVPGFYFWLGIRPPGTPPEDAPPNHSPLFTIDEAALPLGVQALSQLAVDWLAGER